MKVFLLPIEPFEERYSSQWIRWWPKELRDIGLEVELIEGERVGSRKDGEFLDPTLTWIWKGSQLSNLAKEFASKKIKDGDIIFSLDGWGPSSEAVPYIRDALGLDVKLVTFFHAGYYDQWDFLHRKKMKWAEGIEQTWFEASDLILVGSNFHKKMILSSYEIDSSKIMVSGYPIHQEEYVDRVISWKEKEELIVFPHRLAPEKAPWEFDLFEELGKDKGIKANWIKTRDGRWSGARFDGFSSKKKYYELLSRAKVVVSTARQETFGIAMQEAIALGAWAVVPDALSYSELIDASCGYKYQVNDFDRAVELICTALSNHCAPKWSKTHEETIKRVGMEIIGRFGS